MTRAQRLIGLIALTLAGPLLAGGAPRLAEESLHDAVAADSADVVAVLLRHGADVDAVNEAGLTPLTIAADRGLVGIARLLVAAGADLTQPDAQGGTALELAQAGGHSEVVMLLSAAAAADAEAKRPVRVLMKTSMGDIVIELNREKAPITCANFLDYVDSGFYDGTIFHRVMSNFMIQGGGFTPEMRQKQPNPPIKNEWQNGLKNTRGAIAMARIGGQADSATSQFFINVVDNPGLDQPRDGSAYAVFGQVIEGIEVVDQIRAVAVTGKAGHQNVPVEPVVIQKVTRIPRDQPETKPAN